ncbi:unnamed protein product, partial [Discosporangium mesarthrocarpum]
NQRAGKREKRVLYSDISSLRPSHMANAIAIEDDDIPRLRRCGSEPTPEEFIEGERVMRMKSLPFALPELASTHGQTGGRIRVGVCAMDKKARSTPMQEILRRLSKDRFEVIIFGDQTIQGESIEFWPVVDCLLAFHSSGFPIRKAQEYVELRKPYVLNDLSRQWHLMDRICVYDQLRKEGIATPRHVYMRRIRLDPNDKRGYQPGEGEEIDVDEMEEQEDAIIVNGVRIEKPFVEKPADAEDHNIHIYYPMRAGGGSKRLFRKVGWCLG